MYVNCASAFCVYVYVCVHRVHTHTHTHTLTHVNRAQERLRLLYQQQLSAVRDLSDMTSQVKRNRANLIAEAKMKVDLLHAQLDKHLSRFVTLVNQRERSVLRVVQVCVTVCVCVRGYVRDVLYM